MSKLLQLTTIQSDQFRFKPACVQYINTKNVLSAPSTPYVDNSGANQVGTLLNVKQGDGTRIVQLTAIESPSTINTRMNAANTTDVHNIPLVVLDPSAPQTGYIPQSFKTARTVNVDDIWMVQVNPLKSSESIVSLETTPRSALVTLRVENTAASIQAAANA